MSAKTVEEMRKELEAADWEVSSGSDNSGWNVWGQIIAPIQNVWHVDKGERLDDSEENIKRLEQECLNEIIPKAYQHYQQQKQHEAMRELLEEVVNVQADALAPNFNWYNHGYNVLQDLKTKAKKLLESMKG